MPTTKLQIPTGYEGAQRGVERQRKLADILRQQALAAQGQPMVSLTQPLAVLAQAFMARRADKRADAKETEILDQIKTDFGQRFSNFQADAAAGSSAEGLISQYGTDPFLQESLEPYRQALAAKLKDEQELVKDGNRWTRKSMIEPGGLVGNDPNSAVITDAQGNWIVNPVRATAALASQGIATDPSQPGINMMADPRAANAQIAQQALAPTQASQPTIIDGQPFWNINGQWFDNPEGR